MSTDYVYVMQFKGEKIVQPAPPRDNRLARFHPAE